MPKNLSLDDETIHQVNSLCSMWGMPKVRGFSFAVSRAVERTFVAEAAGLRVENFSILDSNEFGLLVRTLMEKVHNLKNDLYLISPDLKNGNEIRETITTEITRLESLIEKIKRAK